MGWYRVCETEFSQMGKNSRNPDLVCKKEVVVHSKDSDQIKKDCVAIILLRKRKQAESSPLTTLCLESIGMDPGISEWCYKGTILQRNSKNIYLQLLWWESKARHIHNTAWTPLQNGKSHLVPTIIRPYWTG